MRDFTKGGKYNMAALYFCGVIQRSIRESNAKQNKMKAKLVAQELYFAATSWFDRDGTVHVQKVQCVGCG